VQAREVRRCWYMCILCWWNALQHQYATCTAGQRVAALCTAAAAAGCMQPATPRSRCCRAVLDMQLVTRTRCEYVLCARVSGSSVQSTAVLVCGLTILRQHHVQQQCGRHSSLPGAQRTPAASSICGLVVQVLFVRALVAPRCFRLNCCELNIVSSRGHCCPASASVTYAAR
jgi:hypothetical protein